MCSFQQTPGLKSHIPNELVSARSYALFRKDRLKPNNNNGRMKNGGGICVYVKNGILHEELNITAVKNSDDLEFPCIKTNVGGNKSHIIYMHNL